VLQFGDLLDGTAEEGDIVLNQTAMLFKRLRSNEADQRESFIDLPICQRALRRQLGRTGRPSLWLLIAREQSLQRLTVGHTTPGPSGAGLPAGSGSGTFLRLLDDLGGLLRSRPIRV